MGLSVVKFGATSSLLADRYFPTGFGADASATADLVIDEVAAEVEVQLRAARVEPDDITTGHSPRAYNWLQNAILKGAAAEVAGRIGAADPDTIDNWRTDFRRYMTDLSNRSNVVLGDVTTRRPRLRTSHAFR